MGQQGTAKSLHEGGMAHGEHGLLGRELGQLRREFIAAFWRKETIEDALALVQQATDATLQHAGHAT